VLFVSLIMLLVLTVIGVTAMQTTTLEEKMAGNLRDQTLAFQAAEAALREGETWLSTQPAEPVPALGCSAYSTTYQLNACGILDSTLWDDTPPILYRTYDTVAKPLQKVATAPRYLIEYHSFIKDSLTTGQQGDETGRVTFRATARGTGGSNLLKHIRKAPTPDGFKGGKLDGQEKHMVKHWKNFLTGIAMSLLCFAASVPAAPLQLSQIPLYLGGNIGPNVMFTLDDSGSMMFEIMPGDFIVDSGSCNVGVVYVFPRIGGVYGAGDYTNCNVRFNATNRYARYFRTSDYNQIYYNPAIRYLPWSNADGTLMLDANPAAAPHNPMNTGAGTRNLAPASNPSTTVNWLSDTGVVSNSSQSYYPATYFKYKGPTPLNGPTDANNIQSNFDLIEIKTANAPFPKAADRADCTGATCTYTEEIQNFANWYTYYRSRVLTARAGVGRAFVAQSNDPTSPSILRVGFGAINKAGATIDGIASPGTVVKGVRKFTGTDRTSFFTSLYGHAIPTEGTPLRKALDDVGKYFERTGSTGPWGETPGSSNTTPPRACRQSYNILMTDGYWNDASAPTALARANVDNSNGPSITNHSLNPTPATYQYSPVNPYKDAWGNTLADVAMYY